jgi:hypothetical protein
MNSFLRDINDLPDPDGEDTREVIMLSTFENDTREICTMVNPEGLVVGNVRVGSIIYRVMIANKYTVLRS